MHNDDVVVAVLTYKRAGRLPLLLETLLSQSATLSTAVTIVVIDNDPSASARGVVSSFGEAVRYVHEPEPGISAARNRALAEAAHAGALVFIDDDEIPNNGWLLHMISTWLLNRPAAVAGPVAYSFEFPLSSWLEQGQFFNRLRYDDGHIVPEAGAGNLLLDVQWLKARGLKFDMAFGLSGGEDTLLTRRIRRLGGDILWADNAMAIESVPVDRLSRRWVLARSFRKGITHAKVQVLLGDSQKEKTVQRIQLVASGMARTVSGAVLFLVGLVLHRVDYNARGLRMASRGAGLTSGALGGSFEEYARKN